MPSPARFNLKLPVWFSDGALLTVANFFAALANYLFQALMRRHLSWSEFGYLNATLSLILFASVPLTAASQTMTHHLARIETEGRAEKVARLQAASLKLLRYLTWVVFGLCILLSPPLTEYLRFPRESLAWAGLLWIPVNLWSTLGGAWCAGLSRFRLLAVLLIVTALLRLVAGDIGVTYYPWAETGIAASIMGGLALASIAVFSPHHATESSLRQVLLQRDWLVYGGAALAVAFGSLVFLQGDQILAQRLFPGEDLGRYTGAGLLGRAVVWVGLPVLTVYFTRLSAHRESQASPKPLLAIYLALVVTGAIGVYLVRVPVLQLFLGSHDEDLCSMTARFALAMVPIGIVQAMGYHYLAARRLVECLALAGCSVAYLAALDTYGHTPGQMLSTMTTVATGSVVLLGLITLARRQRQPAAMPS